MSDLRVYELRFASKGHVEHAFGLVFGNGCVASCQLELPARRLRFLAAPPTGAELIDVIYGDGGMTWCASHRLGDEPGES